MKVTARVIDVLKALHANRKTHAVIVKEARAGYLKKAEEALAKRILELKSGKIVALHFSLATPQDHTAVYDTAIEMLKMHTGKTVELEDAQVRALLMDQWDWKDSFLTTNSYYSGTARSSQRGDGYEE
jgi:hypothetical protein